MQHAREYASYLHTEWELFERHPSRALASLAAAADLEVTRVLDVGCGAGQELLPFVTDRDVFAVGIDKAADAAKVAHPLFASRKMRGRVVFATAEAERLPCRSNTFDVVICRLALPYTRNARALSELARVVRPGGLVLLQFHHARFYLNGLARAMKALSPRPVVHDLLVLAAGIVYLMTGTQPRARWIAGEVFQTEWTLRRELAGVGLEIRARLPESHPETPSLVLVKKLTR